MADVFVSYATEDRERVAPIVEAIEHAGCSVWWDRRIGLGSSFDREIERALDAAGCIVVVWSSDSVDSDWVRNEAQEGLDRGILVPLLLDDVRPPLAFRRAQTAVLSPSLSDKELEPVLAAVDACVRRSRPSSASNPAPDSTPREARRQSETALAVIPFENLSNDPEQEFFSEGIAEDILDMLAQKTDFIIRPRSSSFALKASNADSQITQGNDNCYGAQYLSNCRKRVPIHESPLLTPNRQIYETLSRLNTTSCRISPPVNMAKRDRSYPFHCAVHEAGMRSNPDVREGR